MTAWRTRTSAWREQLRTTAQDASSEFSATFMRAVTGAASLAERARNSTVPGRLRSTAHNASSQLSSTIKRASASTIERASASAALLAQHAKNSTWPNRVRTSARTAARNLATEFSSRPQAHRSIRDPAHAASQKFQLARPSVARSPTGRRGILFHLQACRPRRPPHSGGALEISFGPTVLATSR